MFEPSKSSPVYNRSVKIFISHAERDRPYATALGKALKDAGESVWEPQGLQPGENWGLKSGEALAGADAIVVLLSPESVATEWVRKEIEFAITSPRLKGRLIPVLVRPARDIPWILRELPQWLEADDPTAAAKGIVSILGSGKTATEAKEKSRIITEMASKTGLSKKTVKDFMTSLTELAYRETRKGEFEFPGLGKLVKQKKKARMGRNPTTGEAIKIPAKTVLKFRISKSAKDALLSAKK